jgi:hypothetical protein
VAQFFDGQVNRELREKSKAKKSRGCAEVEQIEQQVRRKMEGQDPNAVRECVKALSKHSRQI